MMMTTGLIFSAVFSPGLLHVARAAVPGEVVINEVGWAGSADSSTDEWIELYNNSAQAVDLTNWHIDDDGGSSDYKILSGSIPAKGYFLIEDHESAVSTLTADAIIDLSLANTGDALQLYDPTGQLIDTVDGPGGAWYAGSSTTHASMERIDPSSSVDGPSNWATSTGSGAKSSGGGAIIGTPKAQNSAMNGVAIQPAVVDFVADSPVLLAGQTLAVTVKVNEVQDLFAYGFEIIYDPAVLHYKSALEKSFLSENGTAATSFQAKLQNGLEGTLLVADARTVQPKTGVSGSGDLFEFQFDVVSSDATAVTATSQSFMSSPSADIPAQFNPVTLSGQPAQIVPVTNLGAFNGRQRYSIALSWDAVAGAEKYRVYRKDARGQIRQIAETTQTGFIDGDGVSFGGFIVPSQNYVYEVTALQGSAESDRAEVVSRDDRGLKGDNNRSDRVDGRDLEALAKHFAESDADQDFDPLVDTTYDARIDGSDLIDLAANFARTYQT